jgi:hypothetical protein
MEKGVQKICATCTYLYYSKNAQSRPTGGSLPNRVTLCNSGMLHATQTLKSRSNGLQATNALRPRLLRHSALKRDET